MTAKLQIGRREHKQGLQAAADHVLGAKRVLFISGAGISCSAGIPDFRSLHGLYQTRPGETESSSGNKKKARDTQVRGKDLFDVSLFNNPESTAQFYKFMAELRHSTGRAKPTPTHKFLDLLKQQGHLVRAYTQNIDGLESRSGVLSIKPMPLSQNDVIQLHGDVHTLKCMLCNTKADYTPTYEQHLIRGEAPECALCLDKAEMRAAHGKRAIAVGTLRPDVVLYGETHPYGDAIATACARDARRKPDLLLIAGTSLKIPGLKRLVKDFAKQVHAAGGQVIFVNLTPPATAEWTGVIDTFVQGASDDFIRLMRLQRPAFFKQQTTLDTVPLPRVKGLSVHGKRLGRPPKQASDLPREKRKKSTPAPAPVLVSYPTPPASEQTPTESDYSTTSPLTALPIDIEEETRPCTATRMRRSATMDSISTLSSIGDRSFAAEEEAYAARMADLFVDGVRMPAADANAEAAAQYLTPPCSQDLITGCVASQACLPLGDEETWPAFDVLDDTENRDPLQERNCPRQGHSHSLQKNKLAAGMQIWTPPARKRTAEEMRIGFLLNTDKALGQPVGTEIEEDVSHLPAPKQPCFEQSTQGKRMTTMATGTCSRRVATMVVLPSRRSLRHRA